MYKRTASVILAALLPQAALAADVLSGDKAFGDWRTDRPGIVRLIKPGDLPAPDQAESVASQANVVKRPQGGAPRVPAGFKVDLFADGLDGPRAMRTAPNGDVFVAESGAGRISLLPAGSAAPATPSVFASGLNRPYGIAFYPPGPSPRFVYVADTDSVVRFPYKSGDREASGKPETIIAKLPTGGHWTRDIAFSPDGSKLYLAVGSSSNAGEDLADKPGGDIATLEKDQGIGAAWGREAGRAAVFVADPDGKNLKSFANGIRNCAGIGVEPGSGTVWCATNERDGLGDNLPPDYATAVTEGGFYGWPWFYIGPNQDPRHEGERADLKDKITVPDVLIQPHSAPLGIAFYDGSAFPPNYRGSAFVTLHGSWNRGARTGYKVVRLLFKDGKPTGAYEDFMTGFVLSEGAVWGRPVGVTVGKDGDLYVSEDGNGTIWRVRAAG